MKFTTKQVASMFRITARKARRILRSIERFNDKKYTRYQLNKRDVASIKSRLQAA